MDIKKITMTIKTKYTDTGVYCLFKWLDRDYWEICFWRYEE